MVKIIYLQKCLQYAQVDFSYYSQLKPKTSPGADGIYSEFFINIKEEARKTILQLFSYIWIKGVIPTK